ncbi:unnamed protein product [Amoebophrya sp. A25]|nr:unnamed protein product [Amoebophrya sp. A25]|eukprot:GSA25T00012932001.1
MQGREAGDLVSSISSRGSGAWLDCVFFSILKGRGGERNKRKRGRFDWWGIFSWCHENVSSCTVVILHIFLC